MRIRHAAPLALVGWILMMPPIGRKGDGGIDIRWGYRHKGRCSNISVERGQSL